MTSSPNIHVGIVKKESIEVQFSGLFRLEPSGKDLQGFLKVEVFQNKLSVTFEDGQKALFDECVFTPSDAENSWFEIKEVVIGVDFHWQQSENQRFRGNLKLIRIENQVQVINLLPLEEYLVSVISSEMNAHSSLNLLKAHAIISRSWLLAQMEKQHSLKSSETHYQLIHESDAEYIRWYDREDHTLFHVCADDHCQRYQGITRVQHPNVVKAVAETSGMVLMYGQHICDARFSKSCGGVAELFENCWEPVPHPYLTAVIDHPEVEKLPARDLTIEEQAQKYIHSNPEAFCNTHDENILKQVLNNYDHIVSDFFRWKIILKQEELSELIRKKSGFDFGQIIDLIPLKRGTSGRITRLQIVGTKKTLIVGKELEIRRWLSPSHLYSSAFTVEKSAIKERIPGTFTLHGAGWGHGVGLCQIGAAVMGEKGYSYAEILMHYYRNATIEKRY